MKRLSETVGKLRSHLRSGGPAVKTMRKEGVENILGETGWTLLDVHCEIKTNIEIIKENMFGLKGGGGGCKENVENLYPTWYKHLVQFSTEFKSDEYAEDDLVVFHLIHLFQLVQILRFMTTVKEKRLPETPIGCSTSIEDSGHFETATMDNSSPITTTTATKTNTNKNHSPTAGIKKRRKRRRKKTNDDNSRSPKSPHLGGSTDLQFTFETPGVAPQRNNKHHKRHLKSPGVSVEGTEDEDDLNVAYSSAVSR